MERTVLVTGAAKGIGAEIAKQFCEEGYNIIVNYHKSEGSGLLLEQKFLGKAKNFKADVSNYNEVDQMVNFAYKEFGRLDVVVNNAGVMLWQLFDTATTQDFERIFNVNVKGIFNICRASVPGMISKKYGRIINISSMWGQVGASCEVIYSAAKAAVDGFSKALAKELAPSNITVNSVSPGVIDTEMNHKLDKETIEALCDETPMKRIGLPSDVANMVLFLASEKASFITGQIIGINGGFVI